MREILFRGKTEEGKWVYGYLFVLGKGSKYEETYILGDIDHRKSVFDIWEYAERVIPETVGQWTGMTDKNGKRIFEGDIVDYPWDNVIVTMKIRFIDGEFRMKPIMTSRPMQCWEIRMADYITCSEAVGNVHDNPELLEAKHD